MPCMLGDSRNIENEQYLNFMIIENFVPEEKY